VNGAKKQQNLRAAAQALCATVTHAKCSP